MTGVAAKGGGKAGRLGELSIRKIGVHDDVPGIGKVEVDAGKTNGKECSRLRDPGVVELTQAGRSSLCEGFWRTFGDELLCSRMLFGATDS